MFQMYNMAVIFQSRDILPKVRVNGSESMKHVSEGRSEPFITCRISFKVFKHYLYLVYVIKVFPLEWSLVPSRYDILIHI